MRHALPHQPGRHVTHKQHFIAFQTPSTCLEIHDNTNSQMFAQSRTIFLLAMS
ncbi:hypothetical protein Syun_019161 [Stephania yunnanensis]|uniref:Uncharacterized protein n=1 Tax=Stephania yunnanensis TaxID=152371 RepID=A0AAP0ITM2_9MAGN